MRGGCEPSLLSQARSVSCRPHGKPGVRMPVEMEEARAPVSTERTA
jgi:hypothetical protein